MYTAGCVRAGRALAELLAEPAEVPEEGLSPGHHGEITPPRGGQIVVMVQVGEQDPRGQFGDQDDAPVQLDPVS